MDSAPRRPPQRETTTSPSASTQRPGHLSTDAKLHRLSTNQRLRLPQLTQTKQIMSGANDNKDPVRVAAGLKGVLARDDVSDGAKARAEERLNEMGYNGEDRAAESARDPEEDASTKHDNQVKGGYKATLKNPNVSDEAKQNAREQLGDI
ncbi:hypothetical protein MKEN_01454600 [Mycena kentingensis (nom. inval.)]|nr:hypothetical protein MKEN_01454600 [Mycena kentingensis (nom. inval.)]